MPVTFRDEEGVALTADQFDANHAEKFTQASHGFALGDAVYRDSATTHAKAIATSADALADGIVAYVNGDIIRIVSLSGTHVNIGTHSLGTPPQRFWLSQGTAGQLTATEPSSGYKQELGRTVTASVVMWRPDAVGVYI